MLADDHFMKMCDQLGNTFIGLVLYDIISYQLHVHAIAQSLNLLTRIEEIQYFSVN